MEEIIRLKANYLGDVQHKIICPSVITPKKKIKNLFKVNSEVLFISVGTAGIRRGQI